MFDGGPSVVIAPQRQHRFGPVGHPEAESVAGTSRSWRPTAALSSRTRSRTTTKRRSTDKAPAVLYGAGNLRLLQRTGVAVIGSRNIDEAGRRSPVRSARWPTAWSAQIVRRTCAPTTGFSVGTAMGRNKLIYGLAEFAVVVSNDHQTGGTWAGAVEALKGGWCPVLARLSLLAGDFEFFGGAKR